MTAVFETLAKVVTIKVEGRGSATPALGSHNITKGTTVALNAIPDSGWRFAGWTGGVAEPDRENTTLVVDDDITVTANFIQFRVNWSVFAGIIILVFVAISLTSYIVFRKDKP